MFHGFSLRSLMSSLRLLSLHSDSQKSTSNTSRTPHPYDYQKSDSVMELTQSKEDTITVPGTAALGTKRQTYELKVRGSDVESS